MRNTPARRRTRLIAFAGAGAVLAPLTIGAPTWASPDLSVAEDGSYIVMLKQDSVAAYDGGLRGLAATKPAKGEKLDAASVEVRRYEDFLRSEQAEVLSDVGLDAEDTTYAYTTVFNGFAVDLTAQQVRELRKNPDVAYVWEDELRHADTVSTVDYLGLRGEGGVWDTEFGGPEDAGDGIVVGVIDSGIWPENPSFADLPGNPAPPESFEGECETGVDPREDANVECNSKLVGARFYPQGNNTSFDFMSPRDTNGHGSHTAGTAAGNDGVEMTVHGTEMGVGSGVAPAARVAAYKALWQTADGGGSGSTAGLLAAVNDAVADGVDVINYSVSGSSQYVVDSIELAFMEAADAGVFVAASAGNSGDTVGAGSVAHNSPWVMTVAASTHDRDVSKYTELGGEDNVHRVAGANRYETAAELAMAYPEGVDTVYIATGDQFADALAGSAAAAKGLVPTGTVAGMTEATVAPDGSPAPVLLTKVDSLPSVTAAALDELGVSNIIILGGEAAVSASVEDRLADYGDVARIAGENRYETAAMLASMFGDVDRVYVAAGEDNTFPDALSGSALASAEGSPVLLVKSATVPSVVHSALAAMGNPDVTVIGGTAAVAASVARQLGADERLAGANRYATSAAVAEAFGYSDEDPAPHAYLATGEDYPDALAASALAGYEGVPVVLSKTAFAPEVTVETVQDLGLGPVYLIGGPSALSSDVEAAMEAEVNVDGLRFEGVGVGEAVGPAPLVDSEDFPAEGRTAADARLCLPGSLDESAIDGEIVICTRGSNARVEKSEVVADAGGIGMILVNNNDSESLNADFHVIPSIHVNGTDGAAVKAYEESDPNPTAFISATGEGGAEMVVPEMAGFSSYGPAIAGGGDLLKPDITAPGVDVIAAVSPAGDPGTDFNAMSGTSMSAPHVAGLAALMMSKHGDWGPMAVKSAMMTTADPFNSEGELINYAGQPASPLHFGSGEVEPAASYGTPLVYESDVVDWYAYTCAIGQLQLIGGQSVCAEVAEILGGIPDASDLNYPSIAVADLGGTQTVTRTVTATGAGGTFTAQVEAPEGMTVEVTPATITVPAGGEATFEVEISNQSAELDAWAFGSITWTGPGADVRSPIAVKPVAIGAPGEIVVSGTEGSETFEVVPGSTGTLTTVVHGLTPADTDEITVISDGGSGGDGVDDLVVPITVPEGAAALRAEVWEDEWAPEGLDLDLFLATTDGTIVAQSAAGGSDEAVTLTAPAAGTYLLAIDYWSGEEGDSATGPLHIYLPTGDEGNLDVTPQTTPVIGGVPVELTASWSGLEAATRYLGVIGYDFGSGEAGHTLVTVTP